MRESTVTGCCVLLWRTYVLTVSEQRWVSASAGRECGASCHWRSAFRWCSVSVRFRPSSRMSLGSPEASGSSCRGARGGCVRRWSGMQSSKSDDRGQSRCAPACIQARLSGGEERSATHTNTLLAALRPIAVEKRTYNLADDALWVRAASREALSQSGRILGGERCFRHRRHCYGWFWCCVVSMLVKYAGERLRFSNTDWW